MLLGNHMIYSCTCWDGATTLDQSEDAKLECHAASSRSRRAQRLLENRLRLGRLGEIRHRELRRLGGRRHHQRGAARTRGRALPGPAGRDPAQDYREIRGQFDRVASFGMFEACGPAELRHLLQDRP